MFLRVRRLLESHKSFAASIDDAIKTRSARLTELVDLIELHANKTSSAQKFSDVHEYLFVSARMYKMCTRSEEDRKRIRAAVDRVTESIPWKRLSDDQVARCLWSIATVGAFPKSLEETNLSDRQFAANKSFANVVWSLARLSELRKVGSCAFTSEALLTHIDAGRARTFSDDELVCILRALATIQCQ